MYEKLRERYKNSFRIYGAGDERSLMWTKNKQYIRFEQLLRFLFSGSGTLLDVGCGFGDLFLWLKDTIYNQEIEYFGIDIMPEFIDAAVELTGEQSKFECQDILSLTDRSYDYVVASGIFGSKIFDEDEKNYLHIENVIKKSMDICKIGVSFDFLSDKTDFRNSETNFHASPEKILQLAYKFSRNIILNNSVMPFEFCITIFKDDNFRKETTVFDRYFEKNE